MSEEQECDQDKTPGIISWNELVTSDTAASEAFYCNLFGWTAHTSEALPGVKYTCFMQGERPIGGMIGLAPEEGAPTAWVNYVTVADVKAAVEKATSLGATIIKEITAIPGMGTFAVLSDPQGATIGLWQFA